MPFFIKNKGKGKQVTRKKEGIVKNSTDDQKSSGRKRKFKGNNEEIESDSDIAEEEEVSRDKVYSSSEEDEETVPEKKLRLAKQYLAQIEAEEKDNELDEDLKRDAISDRLKQDQLELSGMLHKKVADTVLLPSRDVMILFRGHQLSVTCVVISTDNQFIYSGSKDCSIVKWSLKEQKKVKMIPGGRKGTERKHVGHTSHVLALALSSDGKYLASGDANSLIHIWDAAAMELVHTFKGHRDAISGLTFRKDTHQLYSCSHDRSVKIWHVDERAYVETLFGHQDKITAIDSLSRERAITSGGHDSTVRIWKIVEESQLVFNARNICSVDCVALINESNFISGADDNSLSVWGVMKKKPLVTVSNAHSMQSLNVELPVDQSQGQDLVTVNLAVKGSHNRDQGENWITAVAAYCNTDLIASGSKDGCIRLWKCSADFKTLERIHSIPVTGFVNSLRFSKDGKYLVAGIGQEHRLGRWWRLKEAKNSIFIIPLTYHPK